MWGEGASDLWGHLDEGEAEREAELLDAVRSRLRGDSSVTVDEEAEESVTSLAAA